MLELGAAIYTEGLLVAIVNHCRDACLAEKQYPEEVARIRLRLTYLLSRVPEWTKRFSRVPYDSECNLLSKSLHEALSDLLLCVQALGPSGDRWWKKKIRLFLEGTTLLDKLIEAEAKFNEALIDLNHDSTNFVASQIPTIHDHLRKNQEKLSCMLSLFARFDQLPVGNGNNPNLTLFDCIIQG